MAYRKEALESRAFQELLHAYEHPDEVLLSYRDRGVPLVWTLGIDVPEEIIIAADMMPAKVMGCQDGSMPYADKFLEFSFGPVWRGIFEKIMRLSDAYQMEYLACGATSDMNYKIYNYVVEMKRQGYMKHLPDTYYVDLELGHRDSRAQEHNDDIIRAFLRKMEDWCGRKLERADLLRGAQLCNVYRAALREFDAVRTGAESRVTGSEALAVIGGSMFYDKEKAARLVREVAQDAAGWPVVPGARTYFTGCFQETPEVYEMIEAAGGNVIFEDHEMGSRYFDRDVDLTIDPVFGIVDRYQMRIPSGERSVPSERAALAERLASELELANFVVYMNVKDECWIWDYPKQRRVLEPLGVRSMIVERQEYPIREKEALQAAFCRFYAKEENGNVG